MNEEETRSNRTGTWAALAVLGGIALVAVALVRAKKETNRPESWLGKCDGAIHELEERMNDYRDDRLIQTA